MAKKKVRRLCALGESVILVEGEKILKCYNFELEEIVEEIDKVMSKPFRRPADIFKESIENIIGEEYKFTNGRFKIGGIDHVLCDQKIYKLCEEIILKDERFVKKQESFMQRKQEKLEYVKQNDVVDNYYQVRHNRTIDIMQRNCPSKL